MQAQSQTPSPFLQLGWADRCRLSFPGNMNANAICLGDVDNDGVSVSKSLGWIYAQIWTFSGLNFALEIWTGYYRYLRELHRRSLGVS